MATKTTTPKPKVRSPRVAAGLLLSEAAELVDLSPSTLRRYVKTGKIAASTVMGKFGPEYRILSATFKTFALETLGIVLSDEDLERVKARIHSSATPPQSGPAQEDVRDLYERVIALTEEATRYKALCEVSESTLRSAEEDYKKQIAELLMEKKVLEERIQTLEERKRWSLFRRRE